MRLGEGKGSAWLAKALYTLSARGTMGGRFVRQECLFDIDWLAVTKDEIAKVWALWAVVGVFGALKGKDIGGLEWFGGGGLASGMHYEGGMGSIVRKYFRAVLRILILINIVVSSSAVAIPAECSDVLGAETSSNGDAVTAQLNGHEAAANAQVGAANASALAAGGARQVTATAATTTAAAALERDVASQGSLGSLQPANEMMRDHFEQARQACLAAFERQKQAAREALMGNQKAADAASSGQGQGAGGGGGEEGGGGGSAIAGALVGAAAAIGPAIAAAIAAGAEVDVAKTNAEAQEKMAKITAENAKYLADQQKQIADGQAATTKEIVDKKNANDNQNLDKQLSALSIKSEQEAALQKERMRYEQAEQTRLAAEKKATEASKLALAKQQQQAELVKNGTSPGYTVAANGGTSGTTGTSTTTVTRTLQPKSTNGQPYTTFNASGLAFHNEPATKKSQAASRAIANTKQYSLDLLLAKNGYRAIAGKPYQMGAARLSLGSTRENRYIIPPALTMSPPPAIAKTTKAP